MKRKTQINIRLTADEKRRLRDRANAEGFDSVANYLRIRGLEHAEERIYTVIIHPGEKDEGGYWAEVPALPGCNTQGRTYAETIEHVREAIEGYIEMLRKKGRPIPEESQSRPKSPLKAAIRVAV